MFAVIKSGGKQYTVAPGQCLDLELLDAEVGEEITLSEVMLLSRDGKIQVGQPTLEGAAVKAKILAHKRGPKLTIFKKMRRKGHRKKKGHRQELTSVRIEEISN